MRTSARGIVITALSAFALGMSGWYPLKAQTVEVPQFKYDPFWPKPLPDRWVTGNLGGVCVDAQDHVFTVNRGDLTPKEKNDATASPPVIEFDPDGTLVNSWGNRDSLPKGLHGCFVDYQNNIWISLNQDGVSRFLIDSQFG